jgi:Zn-dependent peptidase ImmA (M78 family)
MTTQMSRFKDSKEWSRLTEADRLIVSKHLLEIPVNVSKICKALGVEIYSTPLPSQVSGEIRPKEEGAENFVIRVNRYESEVRQRFTAAHELAHYLLHRHLLSEGAIIDSVLYRSRLTGQLEAEANRLASDLLMPSRLIDEHYSKLDSGLTSDEIVEKLASQFKVSKAAMSIRLERS